MFQRPLPQSISSGLLMLNVRRLLLCLDENLPATSILLQDSNVISNFTQTSLLSRKNQ
jgi:hypothetical protein